MYTAECHLQLWAHTLDVLQVVPRLYGFAAVLAVALLLLVYWIIW
jgi:hypothetical protein